MNEDVERIVIDGQEFRYQLSGIVKQVLLPPPFCFPSAYYLATVSTCLLMLLLSGPEFGDLLFVRNCFLM